jgi:hypothetical protein
VGRRVYGCGTSKQVVAVFDEYEHFHVPGVESTWKANVARDALVGPFMAGGGGADLFAAWCSGNPVRRASMTRTTIRPMRTMP